MVFLSRIRAGCSLHLQLITYKLTPSAEQTNASSIALQCAAGMLLSFFYPLSLPSSSGPLKAVATIDMTAKHPDHATTAPHAHAGIAH